MTIRRLAASPRDLPPDKLTSEDPIEITDGNGYVVAVVIVPENYHPPDECCCNNCPWNGNHR